MSELLTQGVVFAVPFPPNNPAAKAQVKNDVTNTYTKALRDLAPDMGAYINEVYFPSPISTPLNSVNIPKRQMHMNQTLKLPFGVRITKDWRLLKTMLILRMYFGVLLAWGMRGGLRMGGVGCVEFDGLDRFVKRGEIQGW